jgi:hypothetical protein
MLFFVFVILGIHHAQTIQAQLPFLLCILLRAAYLQRSLRVIRAAPTICAFLFFVVNWWNNHTYDHLELNSASWTTYPAILWSLRILIGAAALLHAAQGIQEYRAQRVPTLGFALYYSIRAWSMLKTRWVDYFFAYKDLRSTSKKLGSELRCLCSFVNAVFLEAVILAKGMSVMISARGGIPQTTDWQQSVPACRRLGFVSYRVIGDVLLITALVICLTLREDLWQMVGGK